MEELDPATLTDRQLLLLTYEKVSRMGERVESQGKRITSLETWRNMVLGGAAAVGVCWKVMAKALEKS